MAKLLWGFVGLYLLNISVDSPDPDPQRIPEDLSINDQESMVEIVVEKILGYENAIEEYDDHDSEQNSKKSEVKIELSVHFYADHKCRAFTKKSEQNSPPYQAQLTTGFEEINSPPPKG